MPFDVNSDPSFLTQKQRIRVRVSSFGTAGTVNLTLKSKWRHSPQISCAPLPNNIVCATPNKYRVRHSQKDRVRHSQNKSEDQSGGPRTNLEVFADEVSFQYFQKTRKSTSPMSCKTNLCQSSRESLRMVHAIPPDTPRPPQFYLK